jgi:hypothetical protein
MVGIGFPNLGAHRNEQTLLRGTHHRKDAVALTLDMFLRQPSDAWPWRAARCRHAARRWHSRAAVATS